MLRIVMVISTYVWRQGTELLLPKQLFIYYFIIDDTMLYRRWDSLIQYLSLSLLYFFFFFLAGRQAARSRVKSLEAGEVAPTYVSCTREDYVKEYRTAVQ